MVDFCMELTLQVSTTSSPGQDGPSGGTVTCRVTVDCEATAMTEKKLYSCYYATFIYLIQYAYQVTQIKAIKVYIYEPCSVSTGS